jgi:hypothetical protein
MFRSVGTISFAGAAELSTAFELIDQTAISSMGVAPGAAPFSFTPRSGGSGLLSASVALGYFAYNFIKIHGTLRMTPAMAAGVTTRLWEVSDLVALLAASERGLERARKMDISEDQLTRWAASCLRINHLNTLTQRELRDGRLDRASHLSERARKRSWKLFNEMVGSGARKPVNYCEPDTKDSK